MSNIYLELELFLDPPITDKGALKSEIERKIKNWNKMINANPRNRIRVSKAKEYIDQGLSDLQSQANAARNEKLQELRDDIKKAGRIGGIDAGKLKKLTNKYKTFFSESTINKESGGVVAVAQKAPTFIPPKQPNSLICPKKIPFAEMKGITDDLDFVEDGKHKDLYCINEATVRYILSCLCNARRDIFPKLSPPDFNILPRASHVTDENIKIAFG